MPKITVAIPTYNRADLVVRAVTSVLAQDHGDFEVVVFDNASTDDTVERLAAIDDDRLRIVTRPATVDKRHNINDALHAGSESVFTTVLFSDDVMFPGNLRKKSEFLDAHPDVVIVHSAHRRVMPNGMATTVPEDLTGRRVDPVESSRCFVRRSFGAACRVWFSSAMMRSSVAGLLELRARDAPADDNRLWLEAALHGSIGFIDEPLNSFAVAPGDSTALSFLRVAPNGLHYLPTVDSVVQAHRTRVEFLVDHDLPTVERWTLRILAVLSFARLAALLLDIDRVLGYSRRQLRRQLTACLLAEPLIGLIPAPWRAISRRHPHRAVVELLDRTDDLRPWDEHLRDEIGGLPASVP